MNKPIFGTYRGWSDKWVYGEVLHSQGKAFIRDQFADPQNLWGDFVEVDPKSLAMFTGLYDHENTPVYGSIPLPDGTMSRGGDIVGGNFVRYGTECGKFVGQYDRPVLHDMFENLYELIADFDDHGAENPVIGNAYEDPDLLPEWEIEENKC